MFSYTYCKFTIINYNVVKKISKQHILTIFIIAVIIFALSSPADYISGTLTAFILYAKNVLPALFPFIFFNKMLTMIGSANSLSIILKKPLAKVYHAPAITGYVLTMSIFCGYPIGSKLTRDLYDAGAISKSECFIIATISNVCGPIFIIGTIGSLLGNSIYGYIIYISHLLSTFLNALIYRPKQKPTINDYQVVKSYDDILSKSMLDSIISMAIVGGYIAIMSFFITMLDKLFLTKLITSAFEFTGIDSNITKSIWYGLFEMTKGIATLSACNLPAIYSIPIATFLSTFGGVCIALQSLNYSNKCGVTTGKYFLTKFTQSIIATIISIIITIIVF